MIVDEIDDSPASGRYPLFDGRSSSAAKKADARRRISLARFASSNSVRNRRFSASRSTDSAGVALPDSLCLRSHTRRVSLLKPSSFATRVIAPFAVSGSAWAWMTSSTARALSSSVYFTGKRESLSSNLSASIILGVLHPRYAETSTVLGRAPISSQRHSWRPGGISLHPLSSSNRGLLFIEGPGLDHREEHVEPATSQTHHRSIMAFTHSPLPFVIRLRQSIMTRPQPHILKHPLLQPPHTLPRSETNH